MRAGKALLLRLSTPVTSTLLTWQVLAITEKDLVPDFVIRTGIRYLLSQRKKEVRLARLALASRLPLLGGRGSVLHIIQGNTSCLRLCVSFSVLPCLPLWAVDAWCAP